MTKLEDLLSTVGSSDFYERVNVKKSSGMTEEYATEIVAQEMISETHSMIRALLLLQGKTTDSMSDAEATLAQR